MTDADLHTLVTNSQEKVNTIAQRINTIILSVAEQSIPNKTVTIRPADQSWMHNEIRQLIRQRKIAHKQAKQTNSESKWSKFRRTRNKIVQKIRSAKLRYEHNNAMRLKDKTTDIKTRWKSLKAILNISNKTDVIPNIEYNDKIHETNIGKAEAFNPFFIKQSQLSKDAPMLSIFTSPKYLPLAMVNISSQDVIDILRYLNTIKASGPDLINPPLLREAAAELCGLLSEFFKKSLP